MKYLFLLLSSFCLLSFSFPDSWIRYTSRQGHYSIEFPGTPTEYTINDSDDNGKVQQIHYATYLPNDSEGYMADWVNVRNTFPKGKKMKDILSDTRDAALRSVHAVDVRTTAIDTGKQPYIEFTFSNQAVTGKGRIYFINKIQYSILTMFPAASGLRPGADQFIRSFRHLQ